MRGEGGGGQGGIACYGGKGLTYRVGTIMRHVVVECGQMVQRGWKVPNKTLNKIGLINETWNNGH